MNPSLQTDAKADPVPFEHDGPTHSEDGVDLTLIRWMLSLTPDERLDALEQMAQSIQELRDANPHL
ncbi:MAG: hypothetical protein K2R98_24255 [Gemmataceae bacterium]|nr:hypothetical protein [Gemmataceae bacterium]